MAKDVGLDAALAKMRGPATREHTELTEIILGRHRRNGWNEGMLSIRASALADLTVDGLRDEVEPPDRLILDLPPRIPPRHG